MYKYVYIWCTRNHYAYSILMGGFEIEKHILYCDASQWPMTQTRPNLLLIIMLILLYYL